MRVFETLKFPQKRKSVPGYRIYVFFRVKILILGLQNQLQILTGSSVFCRIIYNIFIIYLWRKMKWSEVRRIAMANGWYLWSHGSRHDIFRHPDRNDVLVLERHDKEEVKPGLYYKLRKQIGF